MALSRSRRRPAPAVIMLALAGVGFLLAAVAYNAPLLQLLARRELHPGSIALIHQAQWHFATIGFALGALAVAGDRVVALDAWLRRPLTTNGILALLFLCGPLVVAELSLRPLARSAIRHRTVLFERDEELGWRLRPGARVHWAGVDIEINDKGLRGPVLPYAKEPSCFRIVWLGDSVTFGYSLPRHDQAYPYRVEQALEVAVGEVETVNAAVDGWSSWQQHLWLVREGFLYHPDLVVVGFVLNDVTEKLGLARFGGTGEGVQLSATATWIDRLVGPSAIVHYARALRARIRFGADTREGALAREILDVETLARDLESEEVRRAWEITLDELRQIFAACAERGVPVALVAFPFTFQFEDPERLAAPQAVLQSLSDTAGVPFLDLLPPLVERLATEGASPSAYFLDADHPSARGSQVIGELVSEFLLREGLAGPWPRSQASAAESGWRTIDRTEAASAEASQHRGSSQDALE